MMQLYLFTRKKRMEIVCKLLTASRHLYSRMVVMILTAVAILYGQGAAPAWMDTAGPRLTIEPVERWHRAPFSVILKSVEPAELWFSKDRQEKMQRYKKPVLLTKNGTYRVYYYGEDDYGNRSSTDSIQYVLDMKPPELRVHREPGIYRKFTPLVFGSDEPCSFYMARDTVAPGKLIRDTLILTENLDIYITAMDRAGNRTRSVKLKYDVDTSKISVGIDPPAGIYNLHKEVSLKVPEGMSAFYTFDPLAPPEWFSKYTEPFRLPHGLTIVRFFGRSASGLQSEIGKVSYIIDTIAPKLVVSIVKGAASDTLLMYCKESSVIRYTADGSLPKLDSRKYTVPLVIFHEGISRIKAKAWDKAGNSSQVYTWEYKYDYTPPVISITPGTGTRTAPFTVDLMSNEPARILYSLDSTEADTGTALVFQKGAIAISRQGKTCIRFRGVDAAENWSDVKTACYVLDSKPPEIQAVVEGDIARNSFVVYLSSPEPVRILYLINNADKDAAFMNYSSSIQLKSGDVLRYYGVDSVGNTSTVAIMDDLDEPLIEANPSPGTYNRKVKFTFNKSVQGNVYWRLLPDTLFRQVNDTLALDREGGHTFEYFLKADNGLRSAIRRNEYFLDWTPPEVAIRLQKGIADSAVLFFEASENASIYFTTDGTNPLFSATTRTAGNKFQRAFDRVALLRNPATRLAYYSEDAAGNQSALTILDVFRPRVIPSVPAGSDRIHDRILSVNLQSPEGSVIHFLRNGRTPTLQSPVYSEPVNLSTSDTIVAFVVDPSGYQGPPETFIYLIDLPPSPQFSVYPDTVYSGTQILLDAKGTLDRETPYDQLNFRWDFDGDGVFDTDTARISSVKYMFQKPGIFHATMEVVDGKQRRAQFKKEIGVRERCPDDMIASFDTGGEAFCIDKYEWPNRAGELPDANVSWVEAKMNCLDAGKRLCTASEWISACNNNARSMYPYGDRYDRNRCATEEKSLVKSGDKRACESAGVSDMVGNAWEWIEEKNNDMTQAYGGSFKYGKDAHCQLKFEGSVASHSDETGFRCCK